ncbi:MAG: hypothetical protein JO291_16590 [Acidimicrobiia bacterium]|nr:hypothetical protein [Acidimicrobiia bacterium]
MAEGTELRTDQVWSGARLLGAADAVRRRTTEADVPSDGRPRTGAPMAGDPFDGQVASFTAAVADALGPQDAQRATDEGWKYPGLTDT